MGGGGEVLVAGSPGLEGCVSELLVTGGVGVLQVSPGYGRKLASV